MKRNYFTFDNIGGDYPLLREELRRGTPTAVFGVSDSLKYLLAGLIDAPIVYVVSDGIAARKTAENIRALSGKRVEVLAAKDEVLLYRKALSKDSLFRRLNGIYAMQSGCDVIVAEIDALIQAFPKKIPVLTLAEGEDFDFLSLLLSH
jgi:transcription-repair coupling factor (superfamily II helicase)